MRALPTVAVLTTLSLAGCARPPSGRPPIPGCGRRSPQYIGEDNIFTVEGTRIHSSSVAVM